MTTAIAGQADTWSYDFEPFERQEIAAQADVDELLYGGAAGGGKTDLLLSIGVNWCLQLPGAKVLMFRRTFKQLEKEVIPRIRARIPRAVGRWNDSKHTMTFLNGSIFEFGYMESDQDVYNYLSAEYVLILWDELTTFPTSKPYLDMFGRLRVAGKLAARMKAMSLRPKMMAGTNPPGPGFGWVKERFHDPDPLGTGQPFDVHDEEGKVIGTGAFVKSLPTDNPHLDIDDYRAKLARMDPVLRRAYEHGDWNIAVGGRFSQFRVTTHVIEPAQVPLPLPAYARAVGVDYGLEDPFVALWGALLPDGLVVVYRELYKRGLTAAEQVDLLLDSEQDTERIPGRPIPVALDPSTWSRQSESVVKAIDKSLPPVGSIAHFYRKRLGGSLKKARNDRVPGWQLVDHHLRIRRDGLPRLLIYSTCTNLIRTLPALMRSTSNPEDVATKPKQDDHAGDALRYLLMELVGGGVLPDPGDPVVPQRGPVTSGLREQRF